MELGLRGKTVLVTGASKGIGKAIAQAFVNEGARVALNARGGRELDQAVADIWKTGSDVVGIPADVTKPEDAERLVADVVRNFGTIHVLVNNAGGIGSFASFEELTDKDWMSILELNIMSAVRVTRAALPYMKKQKWGRIINISSESGVQPDAAMPHYNASKAALNSLTKSLSKAYAMDGILVNAVSPAFIMTPLVEEMLDGMAKQKNVTRAQAEADFLKENRPHIELKRAGKGDEVASAVVYLASEAASFITGTNLRVDGGAVASV